MSKRTLTLIIVILLVAIGLVGWYLLGGSNPLSPNRAGQPNQNLFPFGQRPGGATSTPAQQGNGSGNASTTINLSNPGGTEVRSPQLRQISTVPTAGAVAFDVASSTMIRYMERATGHIYETDSDGSSAAQISNVTLPKIIKALWADDGKRFLARYLKDDGETIRTFFARMSTSTPGQAIEGYYLPDGIGEIAVNGGRMFYTVPSAGGVDGIVSNIDGSSRALIWSSAFSEWTPVWTSASSITLYTKPSGVSQGNAYSLDAKTGSYAATVADVNGLAAVGNADNSLVLYSQAGQNAVATMIYDTKTAAAKPLGVSTFADKCAWSSKVKTIVYCAVPGSIPSGLYPDDWYKGKVSFNDTFWKIDTVSGATENIEAPELDTGTAIDAIDLSLDKNENVLLFTNKKDMTVWRFRFQP